jgi:hypothetical protein
MVCVKEGCSNCGKMADVSIGQSAYQWDVLVWSQSLRCSHCGYCMEADYGGFPDTVYREMILVEEGAWELVVLREQERTLVARSARNIWHMSLQEAMSFARRVPGVLWVATRVEVTWFGDRLRERGVISESRKACSLDKVWRPGQPWS